MAGSAGVNLLTNAAASSPLVDWPGGLAVFSVSGTFNTGTVKLQLLGPDAATLLDAGVNTTLTAPGMGVAYLPPCQVQATVVGGPPSGIYASLARVVG
jgi:hypothetical protein